MAAAMPMAAPAPIPAAAPAPMPLPVQDLSGLEDQLRNITNQIETLRKPGVEQAINALRDAGYLKVALVGLERATAP